MKITKKWAMPNKQTFDIKPIKELIDSWHDGYFINNSDIVSIDPFANKNKIAKITNDLDSQYNTDYNMDALDFLKILKDKSVDFLLFDPHIVPDKSLNATQKWVKQLTCKLLNLVFGAILKKKYLE